METFQLKERLIHRWSAWRGNCSGKLAGCPCCRCVCGSHACTWSGRPSHATTVQPKRLPDHRMDSEDAAAGPTCFTSAHTYSTPLASASAKQSSTAAGEWKGTGRDDACQQGSRRRSMTHSGDRGPRAGGCGVERERGAHARRWLHARSDMTKAAAKGQVGREAGPGDWSWTARWALTGHAVLLAEAQQRGGWLPAGGIRHLHEGRLAQAGSLTNHPHMQAKPPHASQTAAVFKWSVPPSPLGGRTQTPALHAARRRASHLGRGAADLLRAVALPRCQLMHHDSEAPRRALHCRVPRGRGRAARRLHKGSDVQHGREGDGRAQSAPRGGACCGVHSALESSKRPVAQVGSTPPCQRVCPHRSKAGPTRHAAVAQPQSVEQRRHPLPAVAHQTEHGSCRWQEIARQYTAVAGGTESVRRTAPKQQAVGPSGRAQART